MVFKINVAAVLLLITPLILSSGCKKNPTEAGNNSSPGRRDYTWTVDTIHVPRSTIIKMWGSSTTDIWAIADPGEFDSTIFHYDGMKWTCDGVNRSLAPKSLYGFSEDNVWIGDTDGEIWHFDGTVWSEYTTLNYLPDKKNVWEGIWGASPNDIYAVGAYPDSTGFFNNGVIAHYNGTIWQLINIKKNTTSSQIYKSSTDNKYYIDGLHWNLMGDSSFIFQFDGQNIKTLYSGTVGTSQSGEIALVGNEVLFILGRKIATYDGANFHDVTYINEPRYDNGIIGRSRADLFLFTLDGIAHYNGSDVQYLFRINSNERLRSAIIFNTQIIFTALDYNTGNTLIIKGELKN